MSSRIDSFSLLPLLVVLVIALAVGFQAFAGAGREGPGREGSGRDQAGQERAGEEQGAGAESSAAGAGFPLTIRDDTGHPLRLARKPERIISLTVFSDDVLIDLVEQRRLLGVTHLAADPAISNVAAGAAEVPHRLTLNVEVILSLQPDLVIVADWSEADKIAQLRNAGVPVFLLATALSLEDIRGKIRLVARLVGEQQKAELIIAGMDRRLAEVRRRVSAVPEAKRQRVMDFATWGSAQGAGSSWDEIVRQAGLINAAASFSADELGQVPLSKEKILELDPDLLILPGWVYGDPEGAKKFFQQVVSDPALRGLRALRQGRVYQMPEGLKTATSQYMVEAVEYLARLAYPELFP